MTSQCCSLQRAFSHGSEPAAGSWGWGQGPAASVSPSPQALGTRCGVVAGQQDPMSARTGVLQGVIADLKLRGDPRAAEHQCEEEEDDAEVSLGWPQAWGDPPRPSG